MFIYLESDSFRVLLKVFILVAKAFEKLSLLEKAKIWSNNILTFTSETKLPMYVQYAETGINKSMFTQALVAVCWIRTHWPQISAGFYVWYGMCNFVLRASRCATFQGHLLIIYDLKNFLRPTYHTRRWIGWRRSGISQSWAKITKHQPHHHHTQTGGHRNAMKRMKNKSLRL